MSRIGKLPIEIPSGVSVDIRNNLITVKGPGGKLKQKLVPKVNIVQEKEKLTISVDNQDTKEKRSLWGLYRSLIANMVMGVTSGFEKRLEISGIGFKAQVSAGKLVLNVGFSHPIEFEIPEGIEIEVEKNVIIISGIDKQLVGETAARVRYIKKVEPYKLKGIKYVGEVVKKKAGKVVKAVGG